MGIGDSVKDELQAVAVKASCSTARPHARGHSLTRTGTAQVDDQEHPRPATHSGREVRSPSHIQDLAQHPHMHPVTHTVLDALAMLPAPSP